MHFDSEADQSSLVIFYQFRLPQLNLNVSVNSTSLSPLPCSVVLLLCLLAGFHIDRFACRTLITLQFMAPDLGNIWLRKSSRKFLFTDRSELFKI